MDRRRSRSSSIISAAKKRREFADNNNEDEQEEDDDDSDAEDEVDAATEVPIRKSLVASDDVPIQDDSVNTVTDPSPDKDQTMMDQGTSLLLESDVLQKEYIEMKEVDTLGVKFVGAKVGVVPLLKPSSAWGGQALRWSLLTPVSVTLKYAKTTINKTNHWTSIVLLAKFTKGIRHLPSYIQNGEDSLEESVSTSEASRDISEDMEFKDEGYIELVLKVLAQMCDGQYAEHQVGFRHM